MTSNLTPPLDDASAISDAIKALQSATTQDAKNAALQILTQLCQTGAATFFALEDDANPLIPLVSWNVQQAAAQNAVNSCSGISSDLLGSWNTEFSYAQTLINLPGLFAGTLNSTQSADLTALQGDVSSGNSSSAVTDANQFVSDMGYTLTTHLDGSVTSEQVSGSVTTDLTFTPSWNA